MWTSLRRTFGEAPVTAGMIFVCSALFAATLYLMQTEKISFDAAHDRLGVALAYRVGDIETGPHKLWEGEWWRVFLSGLHHGGGSITMGLFHLLGNCFGLWFLGRLLEFRLGSLKTALLLLISLPVSMLPEYLAGETAVGISGSICAVFGYLIVMRRHDQFIHSVLPEEAIRFGLIFLIGCVPATYLGILPVANLAHFTGLGYGYLAARVAYSSTEWRTVARTSFAAAHLLIPVGFYLVQYPVWSAGYHWRLGTNRALPRNERIMHLRQTVAIDPQIEPAWIELKRQSQFNGNPEDAWTAILLGVRHNPSGSDVIREAKSMGLQFRTPEDLSLARQILDDVFDDDAESWAKQLLAQAPAGRPAIRLIPGGLAVPYNGEQPIDLRDGWGAPSHTQPEPLPPPDPHDENSAAVGTAT